jgi:hypothetical protein
MRSPEYHSYVLVFVLIAYVGKARHSIGHARAFLVFVQQLNRGRSSKATARGELYEKQL